jgi:uncharacterized RDD family membrane protein YckC
MKTALLRILLGILPVLGIALLNPGALADSATAPSAASTRATTSPADLGDVLATGDERHFWVARVIPAASADAGEIQTAVVVTLGFGSGWTHLPTVPARVVSMAGSGDELLLTLEGGQWMIDDDADLRLGAPPPNNGNIIAVATEETFTWAIVADNGPTTRLSATAPATIPSSIPSMNPVPRRWMIYQRLGADWINGQTLPAGIDAGSIISMTVVNQRPVIAWRNGDGMIHITRLAPEGHWTDPITISAAGSERFAILRAQGEPMLWTSAPPGADAGTFAGTIHRGDDFSRATSLQVVGALPPVGTPQALAVAFESLRWLAVSGNDVVEQDYQYSGEPKGQIRPIDQAQPVPVDFDPYATGAVLVVLVAVVAALAQRRGRPPGRWLAVPDPVRPAPLGPRLAAGLVDLLPAFAAMGALPRGLSTPAALASAVENISIIAITAYVAHTLVAELICGQSIGKMMFGLRVTTTAGKPAAPAAIIVRNVLRIVDVSLVFSILLMFLTPRRQRLGDLAAGTMVIADETQSGGESS